MRLLVEQRLVLHGLQPASYGRRRKVRKRERRFYREHIRNLSLAAYFLPEPHRVFDKRRVSCT